MVELRAGPQASRLRVLKYLHIHIRFALIELTQARRLRSRSYFDSVISDNLPKNETDNFPRLIFSLTKATFDLKF